jgi:hypothetical protein
VLGLRNAAIVTREILSQSRQAVTFRGPPARGPFILQCSNYLLPVRL